MRWIVGLLACLLPAAAAPNLLRGGDGESREGWGGDVTWTTAAGAAHSGQGCWQGQVTKSDTHQRLTQNVELQPDVLYELSFWARADNQNSIVLWLQQGQERFNPTRWAAVPATWRRYSATFSPPSAGTWELQLIVPTGHGDAPLGRAWVDDLSLLALTTGRVTPLSQTGEIADHASVAAGPDGSVYAAWEQFAADRDQLVVARLDTANGLAPLQRWSCDLGAASFTLWPRLVSGPGGVWLLAAAEQNQRWDIVARLVTAAGVGEPVWITQDAAADSRVAGCVDAAGLQVAWQSNRGGQRRIWTTTVTGRQVAAPVAVSPDSSYNPSVLRRGSETWIAYDHFADGNRDIYLVSARDGQWAAPRQLTRSNRHDLLPQLVWWRDGLWLAWEFGFHAGYNICSLETKSVQLAQIRDHGLAAPVGLPNGLPGRWIEQPALAVDGLDRLWLGYRQPRGDEGRGGWETRLGCYNGQAWTADTLVSPAVGRARQAPLAAVPEGLLVPAMADNVGNQWSTNEQATTASFQRVAVALVSPTAAPPAADLQTGPLNDADLPSFALQSERRRMGEERAPFTFELAGRRLTARWGNFHEHSDISQCRRALDSRTEEDYIWMREIANIDFGAITDHCYNQSPPVWRYSQKITRASHDPGQFVAFVGEEWTSNNEKTTKPPGFYGHRNLIFADPYCPYWLNSKDPLYYTPQQVWDKLAGQDFIMIPHQLADAGTNVPVDWNYTNEVTQPVAEIFQARESYEADECPRRTKQGFPGYFLQDVWRRGIKIGVIASPDHGGGKGKAGVLVETLDRGPILDACRARATWGTSAGKIALALAVDWKLMGSAVVQPEVRPVRVTAKVSAAGPLAAVRVIRNNEIVYNHTVTDPDVQFEWLDNAPPVGNAYYYLRVERQDSELAWSSPVWIDRQG
ncbi:MAG: hypothetical protein IT204_11050 [Fimbriimonadaceae bacterium]|nr:hypothetical protein [Fimbriimonadaceae bacterium]